MVEAHSDSPRSRRHSTGAALHAANNCAWQCRRSFDTVKHGNDGPTNRPQARRGVVGQLLSALKEMVQGDRQMPTCQAQRIVEVTQRSCRKSSSRSMRIPCAMASSVGVVEVNELSATRSFDLLEELLADIMNSPEPTPAESALVSEPTRRINCQYPLPPPQVFKRSVGQKHSVTSRCTLICSP